MVIFHGDRHCFDQNCNWKVQWEVSPWAQFNELRADYFNDVIGVDVIVLSAGICGEDEIIRREVVDRSHVVCDVSCMKVVT